MKKLLGSSTSNLVNKFSQNLNYAAEVQRITHPSNCDGWNLHPRSIHTNVREGLQHPSFQQVMDGRRHGAAEDIATPSGDTTNVAMVGPRELAMEGELICRVWVGLKGQHNTARWDAKPSDASKGALIGLG